MVVENKVCIIMLGEKAVGKTSLMLRFCKDTFSESQKCTLIVDNYSKTIILNDKEIVLELWDTAGQERYKSIIKEYFRKADGVLLTYDMTRLETFMKLSSWLDELRQLNEEATVLIVGNKSDLPHQNHVSRSTVETYAREEGLEFCETSAKNNENVDEVFKNLTLKVLERKKAPTFADSLNCLPNGDIEAENSTEVASDSSRLQTENTAEVPTAASLPPIVRLEDDFGQNDDVIKLTLEKPKEKKQKSCC